MAGCSCRAWAPSSFSGPQLHIGAGGNPSSLFMPSHNKNAFPPRNETEPKVKKNMFSTHSETRRSVLRGGFSLLLSGLLLPRAQGDDSLNLWTTYQTPDAFLKEAFGTPPAPKVLPLDAAAQAKISLAFERAFPQTQLRYWRANGRSAWIFDDLGKQGYQLTTAGFVVKDKAIDFARVLIYRESRGEQVAEPSFLKKLAGSRLVGGARLNHKVDNISGATLSVNMMQRMAATALVLDSIAP